MKKIFIFLPILLFSQINVKLKSYFFNEEYFKTGKYITTIQNNNKTFFLGQGQTFFGDDLYIYKTFNKNYSTFYLGGFANRVYGQKDNKFYTLSPIITIDYKKKNFVLEFGTLLKSFRKDLIDALYDRELIYYRSIENGFLIKDKIGNFRYKTYINWQQINNNKNNEKFDVSLISSYKNINLQGHYVHRGGQLYKNLPIMHSYAFALILSKTINNFTFYLIPTLSAYIDKSEFEHFKFGKGVLFKINYKNYSLKEWIGNNFYTKEGNPFYKSSKFTNFTINKNNIISKNLILITSFNAYLLYNKIFEHNEKIEIEYKNSL